MKSLFAVFSMVLVVFSCNLKAKNVSSTEVIKTKTDTIKNIEKPNIYITKSFVLGKFDYKIDSTFTKVNSEHSAKLVYLNKTVYSAFLKMHDAAKKDSVDLTILSGTRNFNEQKAIWERKWNTYSNLKPFERAKKILEYSSMPSTSRHHWGTDIDINSLSNSYFSSGKGLKEYEWLTENANAFGFYQVYTEKNHLRTGYNLEKWHWSYLPLASQYLQFYNNHIVIDDINGFKGFEVAQQLKVITAYVNGISQKAKDYK